MTSDLEDAIADALRAKADAAPVPSMPPLGRTATSVWPRRLVPVAAALVVVVAAGAALLTFQSRGDDAPVAPPVATAPPTTADSGPAPGEVFYRLRLTDLRAGGVLREQQLWQQPARTGEWQQEIVQGMSIENGRVVPGGGAVGAPPGGVCYPARLATDESCTAPATWFNPTIEFLAAAPRDPATIGEQLHAQAAGMVEGSGPEFDALVRVLELRTIGELLAGNGVPPDLSSALRKVVEALPGVTVTEDMADLVGARGTGYSLPIHPLGGSVAVIFDADDRYLGSPTEAVRHGVAPGLGQPPSRMLD